SSGFRDEYDDDISSRRISKETIIITCGFSCKKHGHNSVDDGTLFQKTSEFDILMWSIAGKNQQNVSPQSTSQRIDKKTFAAISFCILTRTDNGAFSIAVATLAARFDEYAVAACGDPGLRCIRLAPRGLPRQEEGRMGPFPASSCCLG
ncbi:unnamed protein product, partial [Allacma fusca]